jgi:hypothetical protein
MKNYVIELSFWIDKNKKEYENVGFSLINQKFYLFKIRLKYLLNSIFCH